MAQYPKIQSIATTGFQAPSNYSGAMEGMVDRQNARLLKSVEEYSKYEAYRSDLSRDSRKVPGMVSILQQFPMLVSDDKHRLDTKRI